MPRIKDLPTLIQHLFLSRDKVLTETALDYFCDQLEHHDIFILNRAIQRLMTSDDPFIADLGKVTKAFREEQLRPKSGEEILSDTKSFMVRFAVEAGIEVKALESEIKDYKKNLISFGGKDANNQGNRIGHEGTRGDQKNT